MERARYLIELRRPSAGWGSLGETVARARGEAAALQAQGVPLRLVRSVFVPEDDTCFLLYEGPSAGVVADAVRRAANAGDPLSGIWPLDAKEGTGHVGTAD